jgi:hypothetical protein
LLDDVRRAERRQRDRVGSDRVETGEDLAALARQVRPSRGVGVVAQDLARDRLALDPVHHEAGAESVPGLEERPHGWHRHTGRPGRSQHLELGRPVGYPLVGGGIPPQHERQVLAVGGDGIERPRLAGRPTRQAQQALDADRRTEVASDDRGQALLVGPGGHAAHRSRVTWNGRPGGRHCSRPRRFAVETDVASRPVDPEPREPSGGGSRLWDLLPIAILVIGFGFWTIDKWDAARNSITSVRAVLVVLGIAAGWLLLSRVVLPRLLKWAWARSLVMSGLAIVLLLYIVVPYYDKDEKSERFVTEAASEPADEPEAGRGGGGQGGRQEETEAPQAPVLVRTGGIGGLDGHDGSGTIEVYRDVDGTFVVQFAGADIEGTPGPVVYLVPEAGAENPGGTNLGGLQAEVGDFFYDGITDDLSSGDWTVLVWCEPFGVAVAGATVTSV